jgi:hypothetical protein
MTAKQLFHSGGKHFERSLIEIKKQQGDGGEECKRRYPILLFDINFSDFKRKYG